MIASSARAGYCPTPPEPLFYRRLAVAVLGFLFGALCVVAAGCGGKAPAPQPEPLGSRVSIRVRAEGGGNKSLGGALVTIAIRGEKKTRGTAADGWVRFENVDRGPRHLWVTKKGYRDYDRHFEVKGADTTLTVAIRKVTSAPKPPPGPNPGPTPPLTSDKVTALRRVAQAYLSEYKDAHGNHGQPGAKYEAFVRRAAAVLHYGSSVLGVKADPSVMLNGKRRTDTLSQDALWTPDGIYDFLIGAGQHGSDLNKIVWNKVDSASNGKAIKPDSKLVPKNARYPQPQGVVKSQGAAFADRNGAFVAVGHTLFPAIWLQRHDPRKLDANLKWLADRNVDFIRIILELSGPYWKDREQNPLSSGFDSSLAQVIDKAYGYGLRTQVTIFGEWNHANSRAKRRQVVEMVARVINTREEKTFYVEIANEAGKPGRWNDVGEIHELARLFKSREPSVLVALTAPISDSHVGQLYDRAGADVATFHVERVSGSGVSISEAGRSRYTKLKSSGEPRGCKASAGGDVCDPGTLVNDFKQTINAGIGAYVIHTRAGIGMGSVNWPEPNLWSHSTADAIVRQIIAARNAMPGDQANR